MENFRKSFFELIDVSSSIIITSHISPDDDSIASVLSMYDVVTKYKSDVQVRIVYTAEKSNEVVGRYGTFQNFEQIEFVDDVANHLNSYDLLIMLDGAEYHRFSRIPEKLQQIKTSVVIDHHSSPPDNFTISYIDTNSSSNAENIYSIFYDTELPSKKVAEIFLLGILADTGTFRFLKPTQTKTFTVAKNLVEIIGISIDEFLSRYNQISTRAFMLLQEYIKNTVFDEIDGWPKFQYTFASEKYIRDNNFLDSEISSASSMYAAFYIRNIQEYSWGFTVNCRTTGDYNVSFRSLPKSVNVRDFAERMKIGGGHDRAAGGGFKKTDGYGSVSACVDAIKEFMRNNKPLIS